ncbi:MAG: 16S rRNA (cytosine(967)-C(5))-methyltransferase RsmB [Clostridia bacterium]|nr:16S rRNA (cytosine(967)-C(5))-methyltransferase RsmB [Clostridia bacterium]
MIDKVREIALKALYKIDKEGAYSNIALDEVLNNNREKVDERDVGLISEIVYGTITWKLTIDEIIKKYSNIRIKKISPWILNILRMGIYQIIFLDKIPKSAAVNESVNLAKRYGHKSSSNFVNAVLRKIDKCDYNEFFKIEDDKIRISLTTSMPIWIIDELLKNKTIEEVEGICKSSNIRPKISIRINKLKTNKRQLGELLKERDIGFEDGVLDDFLVLTKAKSIENLDLFKQGMFTIQDEATGLTAKILNPKPNEKVLDCCSAPGGKTTYMAEIMENRGEIEAWDIYEHRTRLIEITAKRLGIDIIKTKVQDATIYNEELFEKYDKILLDVPCLGIGVLKRKPDIKWQKNKEDIEEIIKLQQEILNVCSKYLKKGGEIVYSTCSILKEENEDIIKRFLQKNSEFEIAKYNLDNQNYFNKFVKNNKYIQVYQNEETDGFFICKMAKK